MPQHKKWKLIATIYISLSLILTLTISAASAQSLGKNNQLQPAQSALSAREAGLVPVEVDIEVESIHDISIKDNSFMADGFIAISFPGEIASRKDITTQNPCFTFENNINRSQLFLKTRGPETNEDGKNDQKKRFDYDFSGKFDMGQRQQYQHYPFGTLQLPIIVSTTCHLDYIKSKVALVTEGADSNTKTINALTANLELPAGYSLLQSSLQGEIHKWPRSSFSWMVADLKIKASSLATFFHWIVPLVVVLGIAVISPSLNTEHFAQRIGIPSSSVLTLVFMHQSYRSNLPDLPYLTYLDKLFVYFYIMCFIVFISMAIDRFNSWSNQVLLKVALPNNNRISLTYEGIVQLSCVAGFFLVALIGWYF